MFQNAFPYISNNHYECIMLKATFTKFLYRNVHVTFTSESPKTEMTHVSTPTECLNSKRRGHPMAATSDSASTRGMHISM